nr:uncharacterized protein At4g00950-like [Coffea arabica]
MISLDLETENEAASPTSTPKLSLYKLPSKQRQPPPVMFTPPVTTSAASIPFQWEEVPGKLRPDFRPTSSPAAAAVKDKKNSSVARCLDLPPRLLNNKNNTSTAPHSIIHHPPSKQLFPVTNDSSPTTVLDGPYPHGAGGPSFSRSSAFSLPKTRGSFRSLEDEIFRDVNKYRRHRHDAAIDEAVGKRKVINDKERFASWKWGSYKENNATAMMAVSPSLPEMITVLVVLLSLQQVVGQSRGEAASRVSLMPAPTSSPAFMGASSKCSLETKTRRKKEGLNSRC